MRHQRGFSLREEAWQTSRTRSHWGSESKLRGNPVVFTSSGAENPLQDAQRSVTTTETTDSRVGEPEPPQPPLATLQSTPALQPDASSDRSEPCPRPDPACNHTSETPCESRTPLPSHDPPAKERPSSPASSCASDEVVILFTGRNNVQAKSDAPQIPVSEETQVLETRAREMQVFEAQGEETQVLEAQSKETQVLETQVLETQVLETQTEEVQVIERHTLVGTSQTTPEDGPSSCSESDGNRGPDGVAGEDEGPDEDEDTAGGGGAGDEDAEYEGPGDDGGDGDISDYLANLLASGEHLMADQFSLRDLGDSDDDICMSGYISYDSDSDFGPAVNWSTSRKKKRGDKHAKGLRSGKKGATPPKPHDLFTRYPSGMTKDQVIEELQRFLLSSDEQLTFPPLTKVFRKMLHEMANNLRLKSKSVGKGDTRRPVLYRTKATPVFNTSSFAAVTNKITRRYWAPRSGKAGAKRPKAGGAGFTGYKDGEVVGSGVPELGAENRGRAMLEKMGWSTGMALGTMNTGILQPVSQVVKRSKAGLGQE